MSNVAKNVTNMEQEQELTQAPAQELSQAELSSVTGGGLLATTLSNIANLQHDMQKTVANNIRA